MNEVTYDENTLELFRYLKRHTPERVISDDFYCIVFDYESFHIKAIPEDQVAASQNNHDEVIRATFERVELAYELRDSDQVLFWLSPVSRIWILRTLLYFTGHVTFKSEADALSDYRITSETDNAIADVVRKATGAHDEIVCHPRSVEAEGVDKKFANLVDAGVMLEIDDKLLMCFSWNNSFSVVGSVMSIEELRDEVAPFYEFVEV